jgi:hypothetical protein
VQAGGDVGVDGRIREIDLKHADAMFGLAGGVSELYLRFGPWPRSR